MISRILVRFERDFTGKGLSGNLRRGVWEGWERFLTDYRASPDARFYWEQRRDIFAPKFMDLVDSMAPREGGLRFPGLLSDSQ